jgi:hypothetical protein
MHYFSQREDKDQHLDLLQYLMELNPKGTTLSEKELTAKSMKTSNMRLPLSFFSRAEKTALEVVTTKESKETKPPARRKSGVMNRRVSTVHHLQRGR